MRTFLESLRNGNIFITTEEMQSWCCNIPTGIGFTQKKNCESHWHVMRGTHITLSACSSSPPTQTGTQFMTPTCCQCLNVVQFLLYIPEVVYRNLSNLGWCLFRFAQPVQKIARLITSNYVPQHSHFTLLYHTGQQIKKNNLEATSKL